MRKHINELTLKGIMSQENINDLIIKGTGKRHVINTNRKSSVL